MQIEGIIVTLSIVIVIYGLFRLILKFLCTIGCHSWAPGDYVRALDVDLMQPKCTRCGKSDENTFLR